VRLRLILFSVFLFLLIVSSLWADEPLQMALDRVRMASGLPQRGFEPTRCLSSDILTVYLRWDELPTSIRREFEGLFSRPGSPGSYWATGPLPLTYITPHFKIHYTVTGPDAVPLDDLEPKNGVPDYVEICADAYERAYHVEIELAGFKPPLDDLFIADNGGDARYDIYMFAGGWLGFTAPDWYGRVIATGLTAIPFFAMNSRIYDFFGKSEGTRYLQTTAAHEFFHGIQFAYNLGMPRWFMEACSTWIESFVYDGGRVDDGDELDDPDEPDEVDGTNYYADQMRYWFTHPDWPLDRFDGWHEYGDVIWTIFLTEKFTYDVVKRIFEDTTWGTYRGMGNFDEVFGSMGINFADLFKEFALWNYFTGDRDDGKHYRNGSRYPPVAVHPQDVIRGYPARIHLAEGEMPEHLGSRYIELLPDGRHEEIWIRVEAQDITEPDEFDRLKHRGLAGWGVKVILHRRDGSAKAQDLLLFPRAQEGQMRVKGFGEDIIRVTVILINLNPDVERSDEYVTLYAGLPPMGKLSPPTISQMTEGTIKLSWQLLDISGIKEVAIVRKRASPGDEEFNEAEVYRALDRNGDLIADDNVDVLGRVYPTETSFIDRTVFMDVDLESPLFGREPLRYRYAVVPIGGEGIMGNPAISERWISPSPPSQPIILLDVRRLSKRFWVVNLVSSLTLDQTPSLTCRTPRGQVMDVELDINGDRRWLGTIEFDDDPPPGKYEFTVSGVKKAWVVGSVYSYEGLQPRRFYVMPNPTPRGGKVNFSLKVVKARIYDVTGRLIKELGEASYWDGRNEIGEPVASGIYIILAEDQDGARFKTRIAIK
jgi:hypothetical protein